MGLNGHRVIAYLANVELAICVSLAAASTYYLVLREALPSTSLGRTYGDPWDSLIVTATLIATSAVIAGHAARRPVMRALGLIGLCTLILLIDLTYIHLRGFTVALYPILTNIGLVIGFGAHAWLIVTASQPLRRP